MFDYIEFFRVISALEKTVYGNKEDILRFEEYLKGHIADGDQEKASRTIRSLHRFERSIEEHRALIFKVEAARRWSEAERILFPERFHNGGVQ
ncbi:hypothetical protein [Paenibacillus sp. SI8]|uniref:hypothetical protein n=1 Tax=unclassified Paenibacillus TaxID=185978 RepID=UPI0034658730